MAGALFQTFYLGTTRYTNILHLQNALLQWHLEKAIEALPTLLLLQHHPVYTVGLRSHVYSNEEAERLKLLGADFVQTSRGGLITFHGPGQLVAYPIFNMRKVNLSVRKYVCNLEDTIINLCERYKLKATRSPHTGVWIGNNKICAMGINCQRYITSHGLALNCNIDLDWFTKIVPCGIHGKGVTSLSQSIGADVSVEESIPHFLKSFTEVFDCATKPVVKLQDDACNTQLLSKITGGSAIISNTTAPA